MRHHWNAALGEVIDGFAHTRTALEFNRPAARFLHHPCGISERDLRALLVCAKWHIHDNQCMRRTAHDCSAMHDHQIKRYWNRALIAMHHHAERIPDQQEINIGIEDPGCMGMIGG